MSRMTSKEPRRFVIQRHERQGEPVHWDLMLESGRALETYRVGVPPEELSKGPVEMVRILDHPLKFLSYQGSVNKGKGSVEIADSGVYRILARDEEQQMLEFAGDILKGKFVLSLANENKRWFGPAGNSQDANH